MLLVKKDILALIRRIINYMSREISLFGRAEHGPGWVGFRVKPNPTRECQFLGFRIYWVRFLVGFRFRVRWSVSLVFVFNLWVLGLNAWVLGCNPFFRKICVT